MGKDGDGIHTRYRVSTGHKRTRTQDLLNSSSATWRGSQLKSNIRLSTEMSETLFRSETKVRKRNRQLPQVTWQHAPITLCSPAARATGVCSLGWTPGPATSAPWDTSTGASSPLKAECADDHLRPWQKAAYHSE